MRRRHLIMAIAVFASAATLSTALAGPGADQSASTKRTATKALKLAKKAKSGARKASKLAREAQALTQGPAGGDLTGNYPNPEIGANAVGSEEIANGSVSGADVNESSLGKVPDSDKLDGKDASDFVDASRVHNTGGVVVNDATPGDDSLGSQIVHEVGPFTVIAGCAIDRPSTSDLDLAGLFVAGPAATTFSINGLSGDGTSPETPVQSVVTGTSAALLPIADNDYLLTSGQITAMTPAGDFLTVTGTAEVNVPGQGDCRFGAVAIK